MFENCQMVGHQRNTKWEVSVHKIASNHYQNRPKTNLEQIITPILGPDKTVTPERANLDQQENMIRKGRREERTKIKQGRKSITAENPKPTKHYKNSGLRQLFRTPRLEHRKQSIFEKAATKIGFWARQNTLRLQWFRPFLSDNDKQEIHAREGGARKTSRFFFGRAKVIRSPFRRRPNCEPRAAFSEGSATKNPIFIEEFSEGLQTSKTKQRMTTRGDPSVQHFSRAFLCGQSSVSGKAPSPKNDISANEVW